MSFHLSDKDLDRYGRREMAPEELLVADDHLVSCDVCYGRFGGDAPLKEAYALAGRLLNTESVGVKHVSYDESVAYVEGKLRPADQERIQIHLEACSQCEIDAADLASIKSSLNSDRILMPQSPGLAVRLALLWQSPAIRAGVELTAIALVASVAVWVAAASLRSEFGEASRLMQKQGETIELLQDRLTELNEQNAALHQELQASQAALAHLGSGSRESPAPRNAPERILLPSNPLSLIDGRNTVSLDGKGKLSGLESTSPAQQQLIKSALTRGYLSTPRVLARLTGPPPLVMGRDTSSEPYPLLAPVGTVVESRTPTLRWRSLSGAMNYTVAIYDSNLNEVAGSERIATTEWTVTQPLKQGAIYTWQVKAFKDGEVVKLPRAGEPDAKFKVLDQSKAKTLKRAREKHAGSHLMLAALYAEAGLLDDADGELEQLAQANPNSAIAARLLRSLKSIRPSLSR